MRAAVFEFGVLPEPTAIETPNWTVEPLSDCRQTIEAWQAAGSDSAWVRPPLVRMIEERYGTRKRALVARPVPRSVHQADLWSVRPTHRLVYRGRANLPAGHPKPPITTFLIYLLGAIHGVELQHADWFVSGRQHKRLGGPFVHLADSRETILSLAAQWFGRANQATRTCITSALYIHNHVPAYQWDWERFAWQYAVFDAAWFTACSTGAIPCSQRGGGHARRFQRFSRVFHMRSDQRQFTKWVKCRNDLVHQVTWGQTIPGHVAPMSVRSYYLPLRTFASLALLAAIGYTGKTVRLPWDRVCQLGLFP